MKNETNCIINFLKKTEKLFSKNLYNGGGTSEFVIQPGDFPVMVSAPHAVNHYRDGQKKKADMLTGALASYFHETYGCHVIFKAKFSECDPNYDSNDNGENIYQSRLREYIEKNHIKVLIDLHGAALEKPYAVEMGTAPTIQKNGRLDTEEDPSLHNYPFIAKLIRYSMDFAFRDLDIETKEVWKNKIFSAGTQNTITKYISKNTDCACIQIEINRQYRDIDSPGPLLQLVTAFAYVFNILKHLDWSAPRIKTYRLWQSSTHKPQDKIEATPDAVAPFQYNKLLHVVSHIGETEMVRMHMADINTIKKMHQAWIDEGNVRPATDDSEYIFLTNRLIENLWHREWIQGEEIFPALRDVPVVVYETTPNRHRMGMVKANQVDTICFSSCLYDAMLPESDKYNFIIYNRNTDSRLFIDFSKADYKDHGRIKVPRVMIPRYYKSLLGYLDYPLRIVRKEEMSLLITQIEEDIHTFLNVMYHDEGCCYKLDFKKLKESNFYQLLTKLQIDTNDFFIEKLDAQRIESTAEQLSKMIITILTSSYCSRSTDAFYELRTDSDDSYDAKTEYSSVSEIEKYYGLYDFVEILKIPKRESNNYGSFFYKVLTSLRQHSLNLIIGRTEYYMQTVYTNETDDKNNVSRLSKNMMNLLGVSENDKVAIKYGPNMAVVRVLEGEQYSDSSVGIPAPVRKSLGMNSVQDIVIIYRDMGHIFRRHSQEQTVAIIGTVLAVFQVVNNLLIGALLCVLFIPLILYFALNEERIKVK